MCWKMQKKKRLLSMLLNSHLLRLKTQKNSVEENNRHNFLDYNSFL